MNLTSKTALFSLYDLDRSESFAERLIDLGWRIVASKESVEYLAKHGLRATSLETHLNIKGKYPFPPTLHPGMELALTTGAGKRIDLVYDLTYPASEGMDIGGHTLLALAAKGGRICVGDKEDMAEVLERLERNGKLENPFRRYLIDKVYAKLAGFYGFFCRPQKTPLKVELLLNGENPYQVPAYQCYHDPDDALSIGNFEKVGGDAPCFTNIADFDSILHLFCMLALTFRRYYGRIPYLAVAAKHGNPCGLAVNWNDPRKALDGELWGNPLAIWGGELITNIPITTKLAEKLKLSEKRRKSLGNPYWMLDLIIAPEFGKGAIMVLGKNSRRKLYQNKSLTLPFLNKERTVYRQIRGGYLKQPLNAYMLDLKECAADRPLPKPAQLDSLIIAWAAAWFSNHGGNEVALAKDRKLLAAGGGPSTVDACRTAVARARRYGHKLSGSVFAADAFLPFTDSAAELVKAGCVCGIVPQGGKNQESVKKYFERNKAHVFFLPEQYRGFCRH